MSRSLKAHLLLVLIAAIWGCTFVLVKAALGYATPLLFNALRMGLAAVLMLVLYRKQLFNMSRSTVIAGAGVGLCLFLGYQFQTTGLALTTPSKSAFLTGSSNVMVPLVLIAFWRTRIHLWRIVGIVAAFIGLFLMTVPAGKDGIADFARINTGDLLTMGCAVSFAFQIILLGRATQRFDFKQIAVLQIVVAAMLMFVSLPLLEKPHLQLSSTLVWGIAVTGIFCTALAFAVQSWAQQFTPATHTALIFTLEPVFAWITSFVYMHERLGIRAGAGALLIMAGVLVSELLGNVQQPEPELATAQVGSDAR